MSGVGELDRPGPWDTRSEDWLAGVWEGHADADGLTGTPGRADEAVPGADGENRAEGGAGSGATKVTAEAGGAALHTPEAGARSDATAPEPAPPAAGGRATTGGPDPARRPSARRGAVDPVKALLHRHRDLCERAVDPLEIAAGLEAHGLTDRTAARFRHRDVFSLAEEMYARVPRDGDPPPPRPAEAAREHWLWTVLVLLPGALCTAAVIGLRATEGRPRLAVAALGVLAVAFGLRTALRRGPLRAPTHATSTATRAGTCWLLAYALLGDGLLNAALNGGPHSPWTPAVSPVLALALAFGPAVWCAHLFALRSRRKLTVSRGLEDFSSSAKPLLLGTFGLFLCALGALLALCAALLGEPTAFAGAFALGALLLLARLLAAHGFGHAPAVVLGSVAAAEATALATVLAGRLPGCSFLVTPVRSLTDAWGADAVPALLCAPAALVLLLHALRTLTRASAHARPPGSP
ncbi:hypothetical protein [Streptomyces chiangmaiensis]|uniref:Integral membrane protein n=1 Tax=Streptomyces chiangmaiensis TaxID=766497 RepID=A0ABU7FPP0_9ACTN|nr:hypothetical protein [Streptomyces chiangmaiensis]MED7825069.1 hypothetical protein [Streptomyces chiangmaiensis]